MIEPREHPSGVAPARICEHLGFNLGTAIWCLWDLPAPGARLGVLQRVEWHLLREVYRLKSTGQKNLRPTLSHWGGAATYVAQSDTTLLGDALRLLLEHGVHGDPSELETISRVHRLVQEAIQQEVEKPTS